MQKTITFGGVNSRNLFFISEIRRTFFPSIEVPSISVPNRPGAYPMQTQLGTREIEVDIAIMGSSETDFRSRIRQLGSWLFSEFNDRQLIISDDPSFFLNARLSGSTNFDEIARIGEGTLVFVCHDPLYYRTTEISLLMAGNDRIYTNAGTYRTFPTLRIVPHGAITNFKLVNMANNKQILIRNIPGWQLTISDHAGNTLYRDSDKKRLFDQLDISSEFFALEPGENRIVQTKDQTATHVDVRFIYRERFL